MKRILVFAAYNPKGTVPAPVLYFLKKIKPFTDKILFIADCEADEEEQLKLAELADYVHFDRHGEYDFGSYKRGWKAARLARWLDTADELIFCNDSCFGPVFEFQEMFRTMEKKPCDFWGIVESLEIQPHLQSYFWVFRRPVFTGTLFENFMQGITKQPSARKIISDYEVPMTSLFSKHGFTYASYLEWGDDRPPTAYPCSLLEKRCPLIKRKVFEKARYAHENIWKVSQAVKRENPALYQEIKRFYGARFLFNRLKIFFCNVLNF